MNPDKQKQTTPDYSFITNQPDVAPVKKTDKKIVIIVVLLIFLAILGAILAVVSKTQESVQENPSTATVQNIDVVDDFFKKVANDDIDGAYGLFAPDTEVTKEIFVSENIPFLKKLKLNECKPKEEEPRTDEEGRTVKSYICYSVVNDFEFELEFTIVDSENGPQKILDYILVVSDEE